MPRQTKGTTYIVANPRKLPDGSWIIRDGDRRYFEGDGYDGPNAEMWLKRGFLKEASRDLH